MTVFKRSTLALAALTLIAIPSYAHAQRVTTDNLWQVYAMLDTMRDWGVNGSLEGGRTAAIIGEDFGLIDAPGDPWNWDLDGPYQGAFYCSEKDRKVADATSLLNATSHLRNIYAAAAGLAAGLGALPISGYFATGAAIMATAASAASQLRMQLIGTMCIPD